MNRISHADALPLLGVTLALTGPTPTSKRPAEFVSMLDGRVRELG